MSNNNPSTNNQATDQSGNAAGKKAEMVDSRSSAGGQQGQRPVQVTPQPQPPAKKSNTSGGVLENAAASVTPTLESAKEAISE